MQNRQLNQAERQKEMQEEADATQEIQGIMNNGLFLRHPSPARGGVRPVVVRPVPQRPNPMNQGGEN